MDAFIWKIARPIALGLAFSWAVVSMGCGGSQAARKSPAPSNAETEAQKGPEAEPKAREKAEPAARARAFDEVVYFDYNKYSIRSDQIPVLTRLAEMLRTNPGYSVRIEGYADERGTPEYNLALGQKRADAVKRVLVEKGKIALARLTTISYGKTRPAHPGHDEKAWSMNRRTAFDVTEAFGQMETSRQ